MKAQILEILLSFFALGLYLTLCLLRDALRFASFGVLIDTLEKKISSEKMKKVKERMGQYFEDEGRNLRELEWASYFLLITFFSSVIFYFSQTSENLSGTSLLDLFLYVAFLLFIFGEFILRAFSEPFAEAVLYRGYRVWKCTHILFTPLTLLLHYIQLLVLRISGKPTEEAEEEKEQKILDTMDDGEKAGVFENSERQMIQNIIEFKDCDVGEVMTPRTDMISTPLNTPIDKVVELLQVNNFSRIPIYEENRDNIVGIIHIRDLLPYWNNPEKTPHLRELFNKPYFVPETKKIRSLFQEFKENRLHIAVVLDEYGGTAGLISLEDILEEIVGEIVDEHQQEEDILIELKSSTEAMIQAKMRVSDLNDEFDLELEEDEDYDTVGGMVIAKLGRIPVKGEKGDLEGLNLSYKIIDANPRKILSLELIKKSEEKNE